MCILIFVSPCNARHIYASGHWGWCAQLWLKLPALGSNGGQIAFRPQMNCGRVGWWTLWCSPERCCGFCTGSHECQSLKVLILLVFRVLSRPVTASSAHCMSSVMSWFFRNDKQNIGSNADLCLMSESETFVSAHRPCLEGCNLEHTELNVFFWSFFISLIIPFF